MAHGDAPELFSLRSLRLGCDCQSRTFFQCLEHLCWRFPAALRQLGGSLASGRPSGNLNVAVPSRGRSKVDGIILSVIGGAITLSAIVIPLILRVRMRRNSHVIPEQPSEIAIKIDGARSFTYREMALATNNFSDAAQVGEGGFGKVYKGVLIDGKVVAIKRAQKGSLQGQREFLTEIKLLSRLHHRNLVSLVGYCHEEGEQMLVYEFMSNGTLRDHLSVSLKDPPSFAMRLRIALGSAKGILYLHTEADPPIFHRDIKASNILLNSKFIAKVGDFGISCLAPIPDIEGVVPTHVSTAVKGTLGYIDPEYYLTCKLTNKSDVYSLGIVFLELLTGMQPISHGKYIVREVLLAYESGEIFSVIDRRMGSYPSDCVEKFLNLALQCCQDEPDGRPKIGEVARELEDIWAMMPESDNKRAETDTSAYWVQPLRSKYVNQGEFLFSPNVKASWVWKSIQEHKSLNLIKQGSCCVVGDGLTIEALRDPWVPNCLRQFIGT